MRSEEGVEAVMSCAQEAPGVGDGEPWNEERKNLVVKCFHFLLRFCFWYLKVFYVFSLVVFDVFFVCLPLFVVFFSPLGEASERTPLLEDDGFLHIQQGSLSWRKEVLGDSDLGFWPSHIISLWLLVGIL